jgi:hypothetical protein
VIFPPPITPHIDPPAPPRTAHITIPGITWVIHEIIAFFTRVDVVIIAQILVQIRSFYFAAQLLARLWPVRRIFSRCFYLLIALLHSSPPRVHTPTFYYIYLAIKTSATRLSRRRERRSVALDASCLAVPESCPNFLYERSKGDLFTDGVDGQQDSNGGGGERDAAEEDAANLRSETE